MFFLVYVSSAVRPFSPTELIGIMDQAVVNNAKVDITGLLLYKDGNLMQILEGEEAAVRALYNKIGRDPRHRGLLTLMQGQQEERQFPDWSMGFKDLNSVDLISNPGYSEFMNRPLFWKGVFERSHEQPAALVDVQEEHVGPIRSAPGRDHTPEIHPRRRRVNRPGAS